MEIELETRKYETQGSKKRSIKERKTDKKEEKKKRPTLIGM